MYSAIAYHVSETLKTAFCNSAGTGGENQLTKSQIKRQKRKAAKQIHTDQINFPNLEDCFSFINDDMSMHNGPVMCGLSAGSLRPPKKSNFI